MSNGRWSGSDMKSGPGFAGAAAGRACFARLGGQVAFGRRWAPFRLGRALDDHDEAVVFLEHRLGDFEKLIGAARGAHGLHHGGEAGVLGIAGRGEIRADVGRAVEGLAAAVAAFATRRGIRGAGPPGPPRSNAGGRRRGRRSPAAGRPARGRTGAGRAGGLVESPAIAHLGGTACPPPVPSRRAGRSPRSKSRSRRPGLTGLTSVHCVPKLKVCNWLRSILFNPGSLGSLAGLVSSMNGRKRAWLPGRSAWFGRGVPRVRSGPRERTVCPDETTTQAHFGALQDWPDLPMSPLPKVGTLGWWNW